MYLVVAQRISRRRFIKVLMASGALLLASATGIYELLSSKRNTVQPPPLGGNSTQPPGGNGTGGGGGQPPSQVAWSNLRGACYRWQKLTLSADQPPAPDPVFTSPLMKRLGFNLARVDNMDWNYMYQNQSAYQQLLTQVASYADQSGISCIYHFGGQDSNKIPRALTSLYPSISAFYNAWWSNQTVPSGKFAGLSLWEASFQGLWKPLLQTVDSHPSTLGYGLWNEPSGLPNSPGPLVTLHNYYTYITQRIRTISNKVVTFQVTGNGGGDQYSIPAVAPPRDLLPFAFEGHMYSLDPSAFDGWALGVQKTGGYGLLGEWHVSPSDSNLSQDISAFIQLVKKYGFATTWYSWTCGGNTDLLQPTSCQPTSECQLLSSLYTSILGAPDFL